MMTFGYSVTFVQAELHDELILLSDDDVEYVENFLRHGSNK